MPFMYRRRARPVATTTTAPRAGLFSRRRRAAPRTTHRTHAVPAKRTHMHTTAAPVHHHHHHHHQKRRPTMKDKVSGALMRLKGSLTHRPGVKAAGTRRMHGTDGRGSRRRYF